MPFGSNPFDNNGSIRGDPGCWITALTREFEYAVKVEDCSILERSASAPAVGNADLARNPALWAAKSDNYDKKRPDLLGSSPLQDVNRNSRINLSSSKP